MKTYFQILDLQIQVIDYNSGKSWRSVGSLPFALYATRGINVDGVFYLAGGYHYDGETYPWSSAEWTKSSFIDLIT